MRLLTEELAQNLPQFYSQSGLGEDAVVHLKYVDEKTGWCWFVLEYNKQTDEFYGVTRGYELNYGYFRLKDLISSGRIIRVEDFTPCKVKDCIHGI